MGRPSNFTQEIADKICEALSQGTSLVEICSHDDMPTRATVLRWTHRYPEFGAMYAQARELLAEVVADELLGIVDAVKNGTAEEIAAARLAVDTRKWLASKLLPKKYGDRLDVEHGGNVAHTHMTLADFAARVEEGRRLKGGGGKVIDEQASEPGA